MEIGELDVFSLREHLVEDYDRFTRSFTTIHAKDIREQVDAAYQSERFWPQPLISINPAFEGGPETRVLVQEGRLHPLTAQIFPIELRRHQDEALALATAGKSFVVTTGTGSGKSLCFFLPIIDAIAREKEADPRRRIRALIVYPMNALANSQLEELDKFFKGRFGDRITYQRLTGQEGSDDRRKIEEAPPDILLTNFMMLELLMTRKDSLDQAVIEAARGLRFLVLDELHTYRGRQGADVAMLVRRLRDRLEPDNLQCIGTSATMASEGPALERNAVVAAVASKLFATPIDADAVVTETLRRATDPTHDRQSIRPLLGEALDAPLPRQASNQELKSHPLSIWIECVLGLDASEGKPRRARPLTLSEAADALSLDAGRPKETCERVLREFMTLAGTPEYARTGLGSDQAFLAFKLHQFISGSGTLYSTLRRPGERVVTLEGQVYLPNASQDRLYSTVFCRSCGQEVHSVTRVDEQNGRHYLSRDIDDPMSAPGDDDAEDPDLAKSLPGFLVPIPVDDPEWSFQGDVTDYPENWVEVTKKGEVRLKREYRQHALGRVLIGPDGKEGTGVAFWFMPGRFRFCVRCGVSHSGAGKDVSRLAGLSSEGRSSATSVLLSSALTWLHRQGDAVPARERRLLDFTDNRQDAALQAGHFNDFVFVGLIRAASVQALKTAADGLKDHAIGRALLGALGFNRPVGANQDPAESHRRHWLQDPGLAGRDLEAAESLLARVLAHRFWADQRRGWRYTNPNLEPLGLLEVRYEGLDELVQEDARFQRCTSRLRTAPVEVRREVVKAFLDELRRGLAVDAAALEPEDLEALKDQARKVLKAPWAFGRREGNLRSSCWLLGAKRPDRGGRRSSSEEEPWLSAGPQSTLGKRLRAGALWGREPVSASEYEKLLGDLIYLTHQAGFLRMREHTSLGVPGYRLNSDRVVFVAGLGEPMRGQGNAYFKMLHEALAEMLTLPEPAPLVYEAREHTAQVEPDLREAREMRFRYGDKDQESLKGEVRGVLEAAGESTRMLPVMICSPTMELGVDISQLHTVYMRNVPPTPANYAQRSGRAGRSGQAALVVTYCAARSPHDQYFFQDPKAMVHGEVRAPMLDLANQELIDSHLQAIWLAEVPVRLSPAIPEVLSLADPARPLRNEVHEAARDAQAMERACDRAARVLAMVEGEIARSIAPWFVGSDAYAVQVIKDAPRRFDKAFDRWRDLLAGAERLKQQARAIQDDYLIPAGDRRRNEAKQWHHDAERQIEHLLHGRESATSDFYLYRYLATEGFLPGYNFPRLPLLAYLSEPGQRPLGMQQNNRSRAYIQRPRFLALSEFGPRSLIYHEGRAFRVMRVQLSYGHGGSEQQGLALQSARICKHCGAGHFEGVRATCHHCRRPLDQPLDVSNLLQIDQVHAVATERITADDEERRRQGFELRSTWVWPVRDGRIDTRECRLADDEGAIVHLTYGPGTTLVRLNLGLKRRKERNSYGYGLDPASGRWVGAQDEQGPDDTAAAPSAEPVKVVPLVRDVKNALLLEPAESWGAQTFVTVQHALKRGIEVVFQLESSELLGEVMESDGKRTGVLYYEATEGGAGVLSRLVGEPDALARVARAALALMHLDVPQNLAGLDPAALQDLPGCTCVAGCYRCLLAYTNQPDHESIDRRDLAARRILLRLARAEARLEAPDNATATEVDHDPLDGDLRGLVASWKEAFRQYLPNAPEPVWSRFQEVVVPHWPDEVVAVHLPDLPGDLHASFVDRGYDFIQFQSDETRWPDRFSRLGRMLGG